MIFEQGVELLRANLDISKWTPMPKNEFLQGMRTVLVRVCEGCTIYVDHPYSQYVEIALEYAILAVKIGDEAFRLAEYGVPVFNAAKPRGNSHVSDL